MASLQSIPSAIFKASNEKYKTETSIPKYSQSSNQFDIGKLLKTRRRTSSSSGSSDSLCRSASQSSSHGSSHGSSPSGSSERSTSPVVPVEAKLPCFVTTMQPKLLKQINGFQSKEDLLSFVSSCLFLLDPINLVTCVYRLAKMYSSIKQASAKQQWKGELFGTSNFQLLLLTVESTMQKVQAAAATPMRGLDSRCLSNLVWALVKLELAAERGDLGERIVLGISPLVLKMLHTSSPQGLANLLWAYAKLPVPPGEVMAVIISHMTELLSVSGPSGALFDAQALSNSVWAVAHSRSKFITINSNSSAAQSADAAAGGESAAELNGASVFSPHGPHTIAFLMAVASVSTQMLQRLDTTIARRGGGGFLQGAGSSYADYKTSERAFQEAESKFSCQALVNIVWSFASLMGELCREDATSAALFHTARAEAIVRLRITHAALLASRAWVFSVPGGFNEQALSNIVYAYDKAGMLDRELLAWVFRVASLRLSRSDASPSFKPQELCTLLRAVHVPIAETTEFLDSLVAVLRRMPWMLRTWSPSETQELGRALSLVGISINSLISGDSSASASCASAASSSVRYSLPADGGLFHHHGQQHQHTVSDASLEAMGSLLASSMNSNLNLNSNSSPVFPFSNPRSQFSSRVPASVHSSSSDSPIFGTSANPLPMAFMSSPYDVGRFSTNRNCDASNNGFSMQVPGQRNQSAGLFDQVQYHRHSHRNNNNNTNNCNVNGNGHNNNGFGRTYGHHNNQNNSHNHNHYNNHHMRSQHGAPSMQRRHLHNFQQQQQFGSFSSSSLEQSAASNAVADAAAAMRGIFGDVSFSSKESLGLTGFGPIGSQSSSFSSARQPYSFSQAQTSAAAAAPSMDPASLSGGWSPFLTSSERLSAFQLGIQEGIQRQQQEQQQQQHHHHHHRQHPHPSLTHDMASSLQSSPGGASINSKGAGDFGTSSTSSDNGVVGSLGFASSLANVNANVNGEDAQLYPGFTSFGRSSSGASTLSCFGLPSMATGSAGFHDALAQQMSCLLLGEQTATEGF